MVGGERCGHQANVYGDTAEELAGPIVTGLADQPLVTLEEAVKNLESYCPGVRVRASEARTNEGREEREDGREEIGKRKRREGSG